MPGDRAVISARTTPTSHLWILSLDLRHWSWGGQRLSFSCNWQQQTGFYARGNLQWIYSRNSCKSPAHLPHGPAPHCSANATLPLQNSRCRIEKIVWDFMSEFRDWFQAGSRIGWKISNSESMINKASGMINTAGRVKMLLSTLQQTQSFLDVQI